MFLLYVFNLNFKYNKEMSTNQQLDGLLLIQTDSSSEDIYVLHLLKL